MLRGQEVVQRGEAKFPALCRDSGRDVTNVAPCLMSFPFEWAAAQSPAMPPPMMMIFPASCFILVNSIRCSACLRKNTSYVIHFSRAVTEDTLLEIGRFEPELLHVLIDNVPLGS